MTVRWIIWPAAAIAVATLGCVGPDARPDGGSPAPDGAVAAPDGSAPMPDPPGANCEPRCETAAVACGAPDALAARLCGLGCAQGPSEPQLACLEGTPCAALADAFQSGRDVCGVAFAPSRPDAGASMDASVARDGSAPRDASAGCTPSARCEGTVAVTVACRGSIPTTERRDCSLLTRSECRAGMCRSLGCIAVGMAGCTPLSGDRECCAPSTCWSESTGSRCCIRANDPCTSDAECCDHRTSRGYRCMPRDGGRACTFVL